MSECVCVCVFVSERELVCGVGVRDNLCVFKANNTKEQSCNIH